MAGKYWSYHFMPLIYFCVICSCLMLAHNPNDRHFMVEAIGPIAIVVLVLTTINGIAHYPKLIAAQLRSDSSIFPPKRGRVDSIANYLKKEARPGDTAQALDVTGGAIHAMLDARIALATPFVYDYHFYHHIDEPYIAQLRGRFLRAFSEAQPRFVIEITAPSKPYVSGLNTSREFPELENLLATQYQIMQRGDGYQIYQRLGR